VVTDAEAETVIVRVILCSGNPFGVCDGVGACGRADTNADGVISGAEVTRMMRNAQEGCDP
jgi:hypothetical protein